MGVFNRLGRKAEQFKRDVTDAKADEATHQCRACGELLYTEREACPECGSEEIASV